MNTSRQKKGGAQMKSILRLSIALFVALVSSVALAQTMRAHIIDVGQGSAAVLEFPCAAILIDTGGESNDQFDSTERLMDYLEDFFEGRPDLKNTFHLMVLSHPHKDHTFGVKEVLRKYTILNAVTNGQKHESASGASGQKALHKKVADSEQNTNPNDNVGFEPIRVRSLPARGLSNEVVDPVNCGAVDPKITALWGEAPKGPRWSQKAFDNENNHSVVLRVDFGKASMLLTGDLEENGIEDLIARYRGTGLLDVDLYLVGHHGAANATTDDMLRAVTPKLAVISMGPATRQLPWTAWQHGHPRKVIVDRLATHVANSRPAKTVKVATGQRTFADMSISRAIFATGWDGSIILEADVAGGWRYVVHPDDILAADAPLDLNAASVDQLKALPMIGSKRANDIARYRTEHGRFSSVEDLAKVPGIGAGTLKAIHPYVAVK
jgi:competence protein ComEC